jgi:hypothetical protein
VDLSVRLHHVIDLRGQGIVDVLHLLGEVVLRVLSIAIEFLLVVLDDGALAGLLSRGEGGGLRLELLGQGFDFVVQLLELLAAGIEFLLQVGEVAPA